MPYIWLSLTVWLGINNYSVFIIGLWFFVCWLVIDPILNELECIINNYNEFLKLTVEQKVAYEVRVGRQIESYFCLYISNGR